MTEYTITTKSNKDLTVPFNTADPNNWQRGETATFEFEFTIYRNKTYSADTTISNTQSGDVITIEDGVTVTVVDGGLLQGEDLVTEGSGNLVVESGGVARFFGGIQTKLNEYHEWAGSFATLTTMTNEERYKIQIPDTTTIDSLIWGIEPEQSLQDRDVIGVWGLVTNIDNQRNQALTIERYSVEVLVLAQKAEYDTIGDVEADLLI